MVKEISHQTSNVIKKIEKFQRKSKKIKELEFELGSRKNPNRKTIYVKCLALTFQFESEFLSLC